MNRTALVFSALLIPAAAAAQTDQFKFQYLGPPSGGRISAAAGIPGDSLVYYMGAASGGVWKTSDGGRTWAPIFDDQSSQAIGALAVARTNPNVVWAGTGEAWAIRDSDMMGDGVYKSEDAGKTWTNMGLRETGRIGRIVVHPTDANIVYVCALGRSTGPQQERGVFKTSDGGKTWRRVLFVDPNTGCSGLSIDEKDPNTLFAATWEMVMHTWAMFSGGMGSGIFVSHDGGEKWTRVKDAGLPKLPIGKVDVAIAPSDSKRVYMLAQTPNQGSVWRSDDGGIAWRVVSWDRTLIGRAGYYIRINVNPKNADEVLVASSNMHMSKDGGLTFPTDGANAFRGCGDCHDIWWDITDANHIIVTGDGGAGITRNHGGRFTDVTLPIGQNYHVAIDNRTPYWVYSNRQDDGTMRGPITSPIQPANVPSYGGRPGGGAFGGGFGGGQRSPWDEFLGGCESGFTIPDTTNTDIVWATCYGNKVTRFDAKRNVARSVQPYMQTLDSPPSDVPYRCHWSAPIVIDPFDHNTIYYGCQVVFQTRNGGQSWEVISPDLSTKDPTRVVSSGGIIGDNLGQFYGEVVFSIAPSRVERGTLWAGTNDGNIWIRRNNTWTKINIPNIPVWGNVRKIEPSHFDAATAYVVVDYHLMDERNPHIYKTADFGKTWTNVAGDLPSGHPLDYVNAVAENPNRKGMLFAGTGHAFHYSTDDGAHWTRFKEGLPAAPVTWIEVNERYHDVVISTYGRGLYALRDIARLEQPAVADGPQLYTPSIAVREARNGTANILFALKTSVDTVQVRISDEQGTVIRTIKVAGRAGFNRVVWNLQHDPLKQIELRTTPPDNPRIWDEPRFKGKETRPITHWGIQGSQRTGPIVAPGKYNVALQLPNAPAELKQSFEVIKDVEMEASNEDLRASTAAQIRVRDAINTTADVVNRIEVERKKLEPRLTTDKAAKEMNDKLLAIELQLLSRTDLHSDDKFFVEAYKTYMNLVWLNGEIGLGAGDMAGGADYRPTDASLKTLEMLEGQARKAKAELEALLSARPVTYR
ncbi:MAG TPA: hypothetical protein VM100_13880 [Longimicrobiales bacterium]|nr:hypothetical protein [Longimicrobiales bacterium]